ncbi:MAG: cardiolipin synthase [Bacteriovoracaceae bacterium]
MGILEIVISFSYILGLFLAVNALWKSRTPQGATAWVIALILMPMVTIPFFLIFGKSRFSGKVELKKIKDTNALAELKEIEHFLNHDLSQKQKLLCLDSIAELSGQPGFTNGNHAEILIDGEATYQQILKAIEDANEYILFQFYIFRFDKVGERFVDALSKKAQQGVRVYFLSDKIGTRTNHRFMRKLVENGVNVKVFYSSKDWESRFQLNFRNHKKLVIVDGKVCITGGLNIGEDYIGKYPSMGDWRDTAIKMEGPCTQAAQISFVIDWYWTCNEVIDLNWTPQFKSQDSQMMVQYTGPSDKVEAAHLIHLQLINDAKEKLWIATPYFIPPESILNALILAKIRGVDVRVLLPATSDNPMLYYATQVYMEKLLKQGIPTFLYTRGFMHQKVLITEEFVSVGSLNMDSRSFFLNFEIFTVSNEKSLIDEAEKMLINDFLNSEEMSLEQLQNRPFKDQLLSRFFNLFSPVL